MKFRKRTSTTARIPTDSMADIAFLLIIFFMVTTAFAARKGIDFRLPKQEADIPSEETEGLESVLIEIDASGRLMIDKRPVNLEDIQSYLLPKLAVNPNKFVIIKTDDNATYGDMIDVLDELKQADVQNMALPSKEEIASWGEI